MVGLGKLHAARVAEARRIRPVACVQNPLSTWPTMADDRRADDLAGDGIANCLFCR